MKKTVGEDTTVAVRAGFLIHILNKAGSLEQARIKLNQLFSRLSLSTQREWIEDGFIEAITKIATTEGAIEVIEILVKKDES